MWETAAKCFAEINSCKDATNFNYNCHDCDGYRELWLMLNQVDLYYMIFCYDRFLLVTCSQVSRYFLVT